MERTAKNLPGVAFAILIGVMSAGRGAHAETSRVDAAPARTISSNHFHVVLPSRIEVFPTEPESADAPRFKFRGTKGWKWTAGQYLEEIPYLKAVKMNFLMNCYLSMFNERTGRNEWWKPLPEPKKAAYAKVIKACQENGITFCFAMHPQLWSDKPMDLTSEADFEVFFSHFAWAQSLGVKYFSVSMDDVKQGGAGPIHAQFCNKFLKRLRTVDSDAQLIFCPTIYSTDQLHPDQPYLQSLAEQMNPDIFVFWAGPQVVSKVITVKDAEYFKRMVKHRLIIWDNYPVNNGIPTLHLGPVTGRDPGLCKIADGYMSNPLCPQNQINRIPLFTMADYAYNPADYDPMRSIGQAIVHLESTPSKQRTLADLVEAYPGDLACGNDDVSFNAVQAQYHKLVGIPEGRTAAAAYLKSLRNLEDRMHDEFPDRYQSATTLLRNDIQNLEGDYASRFGH